jgi:hypothetical protein
LPRREEGKMKGGRNKKNYFWGYDIVMEVFEGYQLVRLFAPAVTKER